MLRTIQTLMIAAGLLAVGCDGVQATRKISYTVPWQDYDNVVIRSRNGSIELTSGKGSEVAVSGSISASGATIEEAQKRVKAVEIVSEPDKSNAKTLVIELRVPDELLNSNIGAGLVVTTPAASAADIKTSNGAISVEGLSGKVQLVTSNGRVSGRNITGTVKIETGNAGIEVRDVKGEVHAVTSNGSINVAGVDGNCMLHTSNASIHAASKGGMVTAESSNGSIHVEADPPAGAAVTAHTSNASVELFLPKAFAGELRLKTSNGRAQANLAGAAAKVQTDEKDAYRATLNGGGPSQAEAVSSNGSVRVELR